MQRLTTSAATAALIFAVAGSTLAAPAPKKPAAAGPVATQATAPAPAAAAPAAPPINHGPAIPNVCIYADERAVGTSLVGKAASTRMQQLRAQVTAELQAENTTLQNDATALNAKKATLPADQLQTQGQALQARADALNAKAGQRQRELEATGADALGQIHQKIDGILRAVYQQRGCSILLNGDGVYLANPAMDVTPLIAAQLDAVMPTITFDRKVLPAQPQQ